MKLKNLLETMLYAALAIYTLGFALALTWSLSQIMLNIGHFACSFTSTVCVGSKWLMPSESVDWYALALGYAIMASIFFFSVLTRCLKKPIFFIVFNGRYGHEYED